jgi:hypothetical protein
VPSFTGHEGSKVVKNSCRDLGRVKSPLMIFAVENLVAYNRDMSFSDRNKTLRVFLYLFLFLISFLVFDSISVVATVLFAVAVLDYFLRKSHQKQSR